MVNLYKVYKNRKKIMYFLWIKWYNCKMIFCSELLQRYTFVVYLHYLKRGIFFSNIYSEFNLKY